MEKDPMTANPSGKNGRLSLRRIALLGTAILALGGTAYFAGPEFQHHAALAQNVTQQAQTVQRPVGFADVVEKVKPAVISVRVKIDAQPDLSSNDELQGLPPGLQRFFRQFGMPDMPRGGPQRRNFTMGQGSGFFITPDGYAVTNNHVVDKAENVQVTTDDGKTYTAKVIGTDPRTDLALIKIDGRNDFPYAHLADKQPRIGDWVLAIGNPFGLGGTVTAGIVSARGRDIGAGPYDDFIQIDAPVNKGNSGGPTFNVDGEVVGVNTAIFSPSGGSVGIAFAIPATTVQSVVKQLREHGTVTRGWIGVQIQPVTKDIADSLGLKRERGALVAEPQPNGPATKAGIRAGDVITKVNNDEVKDARDLAKKIGNLAPGTNVRITVLRGGSEKVFDLTLGELPSQREARATPGGDRGSSQSESDIPNLGLTLAPASRTEGAHAQGVVVVDVDPNGAAAERGFKSGDVILEVAGKSVATPQDVRNALADAKAGGKRTILMRVKSGEGTRFVAVPVGSA
jgi:serine protease Do